MIVRYLWLGYQAIWGKGAGRVRSDQGELRRMNLFTPFSLAIVAITVLALLGLPIGLSMIAGSILYLLLTGADMGIVAEQFLNGMYSNYIILAVPLFILAAELMNIGTMTERLLRFCDALVGRFRGGLAQVNVLQSIIFAGMSGSAIADAAGTGKMMQHMMTKDGKYPPSFAAALTAASAVIGPIIPPSIPMVIYALVSDASIGYLFLGGVIPGLLMGALADGDHRRRPRGAGTSRSRSRCRCANCRASPGASLPALMMPVVLLGGIYGGVTTPTEAAAVAAAYALVISIVLYRIVSLRELLRLGARQRPHHRLDRHADRRRAGLQLRRDGREHPRQPARHAAPRWDLTPSTFLILVNVILLLLGCVLEGTTILLIIVPVLHPDGPGARHRHGAFRRRGGGQHHARPDHAALRPAALHHDKHLRRAAARTSCAT